ncbi:MAG: MmgE/PrpD family protein [Hyphomicrobiaceae bacterium]
MSSDPTIEVCNHIVSTRFEYLPATTVNATNADIRDTHGCILGGSGAPGIDQIFALLDEWGGKPEAQVFLHARSLPAHHAALLNASMGHALDFDDTHDGGGSIHPGVTTLAASLAVADMRGPVSGRNLLTAVTLGLDVSCRVALASTHEGGWHRTSAMGIFGATAAAGKLLGLGTEQMQNALGIAYSHAAGNRQCMIDGALTKRLQAGQAASSAVLSALLAQRNFTGARSVFTGTFGFLELYQQNGAAPSRLTDDLGLAFRGDELSFKPYPCGRPLHAAIDAALAARQQLDIRNASDIAAVVVYAPPENHASQYEAGPTKRRPTQVVEAQFAEPFLMATALAKGKVGIAEVSGLGDNDVLALADRLEGRPVAGRPKGWLSLTVRHRDGREVSITATDPIGSPAKPLSSEQSTAKFFDNAANARLSLSETVLKRTLHNLDRLETLSTINDLTRPFM